MNKILLVVLIQFLIALPSMASTVDLKGGTWLMRPANGNPVDVVKIEIDELEDGTHVLIYTTQDGKESFIESMKVKNIEDVIQMISTGEFVQDYKEISHPIVIDTEKNQKYFDIKSIRNYSNSGKQTHRRGRGWRRRR